jgi:hypothetical protein
MARKRNIILKLLFIFFILNLLAACQAVDVPQWTKDGSGEKEDTQQTLIDAEFLQAYKERMSQAQEHAGRATPDYVLEHVQNMEALIREGQDQGVLEMAEFRQAVHQYQSELLLRYLQPELVPEIPRESVTDEETRAFFEENIANYALPDLYTLTVAATRNPENAHALGNAVSRGITDLEEEARTLNMDLQNVPRQRLEQLPPAWQEVLREMEPGACSPLLSSGEDFAVLRLDAVERGRQQDFEERKEYIRNDALYARYREAWQTAYERLRKEHDVRIDPGVVERFKEKLEGEEKDE